MNDKYKVTYTFQVEYANVNLKGEPKHSLTTLTFDGTDETLDVVVDQISTFLRVAGYRFDALEIVNDV